MNKKMIAVVVGLGMLAMGMMVSKAQASYSDYLPANNTAQITITIAPKIDRSVTITTDAPSGMLDLGALDLGPAVSTQTVYPATVTVQGTIANTDLWLSANIASQGTAWQFDTDASAAESDYIAAWVTLTGTDVTATPAKDANNFNSNTVGANSDLVDGTIQRLGHEVTGDNPNGRFEDNATSSNNFATGSTKRHMWMYFRMPSGTSTPEAQKITFVLTVDSGI